MILDGLMKIKTEHYISSFEFQRLITSAFAFVLISMNFFRNLLANEYDT